MLSALATQGAPLRRDAVAERARAARPPSSRDSPRTHFPEVEIEPDPAAALARAREHPPVLVTGSLYLLAALARNEA